MAIQQNKAILQPDIPIAYIKPGDDVDVFVQSLQDQTIQYGCIQSLDQMDVGQQQNIRQAMMTKFKDYLPQQIKSGVTL